MARFYHTVLSLSLAVSPRIASGKEPSFNVRIIAKERSKHGYEYLATVADNVVRQTIMSNYKIEDNFC